MSALIRRQAGSPPAAAAVIAREGRRVERREHGVLMCRIEREERAAGCLVQSLLQRQPVGRSRVREGVLHRQRDERRHARRTRTGRIGVGNHEIAESIEQCVGRRPGGRCRHATRHQRPHGARRGDPAGARQQLATLHGSVSQTAPRCELRTAAAMSCRPRSPSAAPG